MTVARPNPLEPTTLQVRTSRHRRRPPRGARTDSCMRFAPTSRPAFGPTASSTRDCYDRRMPLPRASPRSIALVLAISTLPFAACLFPTDPGVVEYDGDWAI